MFTTKGSSNFRTSALKEHLDSKDHQDAICVPEHRENKKRQEKKSTSAEEKIIKW